MPKPKVTSKGFVLDALRWQAKTMKLLLTGACGFVGRTIATELRRRSDRLEIIGIDNLIRSGSELNRASLAASGIAFRHCDVRVASDIESLPPCDFVIDVAADPSVLAGIDGQTNSRQLVEHNLGGTINLLEYCKSPGWVHSPEHEPRLLNPCPPGNSTRGQGRSFSAHQLRGSRPHDQRH